MKTGHRSEPCGISFVSLKGQVPELLTKNKVLGSNCWGPYQQGSAAAALLRAGSRYRRPLVAPPALSTPLRATPTRRPGREPLVLLPVARCPSGPADRAALCRMALADLSGCSLAAGCAAISTLHLGHVMTNRSCQFFGAVALTRAGEA